jgi:electron transfer flavoprotein alpha subunit
MSILIYAETQNGSFSKSAFELASYARALANEMDTSVTAVAVKPTDPKAIELYGVNKVLQVNNPSLTTFNAKSYAEVISQAAQASNSSVVLLSTSADSKFLAPLLAIKLEASYASNVVALPMSLDPFVVKRTVFTNKAYGMTELSGDRRLISLSKNAFGLVEQAVSAEIEVFEPSISESTQSVTGVDKASDKVTIADAEVVVSAGRGLKGPENWGMIETLAEVLGAATACSKLRFLKRQIMVLLVTLLR